MVLRGSKFVVARKQLDIRLTINVRIAHAQIMIAIIIVSCCNSFEICCTIRLFSVDDKTGRLKGDYGRAGSHVLRRMVFRGPVLPVSIRKRSDKQGSVCIGSAHRHIMITVIITGNGDIRQRRTICFQRLKNVDISRQFTTADRQGFHMVSKSKIIGSRE